MTNEQQPHELVGKIYEKNTQSRGFNSLGPTHSFAMDISQWPTDSDGVELKQDDFPYLRVALLDRWLEDQYG